MLDITVKHRVCLQRYTTSDTEQCSQGCISTLQQCGYVTSGEKTILEFSYELHK